MQGFPKCRSCSFNCYTQSNEAFSSAQIFEFESTVLCYPQQILQCSVACVPTNLDPIRYHCYLTRPYCCVNITIPADRSIELLSQITERKSAFLHSWESTLILWVGHG